MVVIPLTEQQEQAIAAAALPLGVETWELAVHILSTARRASVSTNIGVRLASADVTGGES